MRVRPPLLAAIALAALWAPPAAAQWAQHGVSLGILPGDQRSASLIQNGAGAIIVWEDWRTGIPRVFAQSLDASGVPQWGSTGRPVTPASAAPQAVPVILGDGYGGAFVTYGQYNAGDWDIMIQHLDANGGSLWGAGVAVCTATNIQYWPVAVSDLRVPTAGDQGSIVAWVDARNGGPVNYDLFIQAVTSTGSWRFASQGAPVALGAGAPIDPVILSDGIRSGLGGYFGAILAWSDRRTGNSDIYAQRIDYNGTMVWTANGAAVCVAPGDQTDPVATGGAGQGLGIFAWTDKRNGNPDVYAQKFGPSAHWAADGIAVATGLAEQTQPAIVTDLLGGAVIAWTDRTSSSHNPDVRLQRLNGDGAARWGASGIAAGDTAGWQNGTLLLPRSTAGAIAVWLQDSVEVRAQAYDSSGVALWPGASVPLCRPATGQRRNLTGVRDGSGGAIVVWEDTRNGTVDLYANKVSGTGGVVAVEPPAPQRLHVFPAHPNPMRTFTRWLVELPEPRMVQARVFGVDGRSIREIAAGDRRQAGRHELQWDGADDRGRRVPPGVYLVRTSAGAVSVTSRVLLLE